MKNYASIEDFIIPGKMTAIDPEIERQISEYMEELEHKRRRNQAQAIIDARNIILGCDGRDKII
jgi:hypothetical protein